MVNILWTGFDIQYEKTHVAIKNKLLRRLDSIIDQSSELEDFKTEIEREKLVIVGFSSMHYEKMRKVELFYNFFDKCCNFAKLQEPEMDTE